MFDCMEDCIHLKACRRIQKIGKQHRLLVPRYCTKECSAYESLEDFCSGDSEAGERLYTHEEEQAAINGATRDALNGYTDNIVLDYV